MKMKKVLSEILLPYTYIKLCGFLVNLQYAVIRPKTEWNHFIFEIVITYVNNISTIYFILCKKFNLPILLGVTFKKVPIMSFSTHSDKFSKNIFLSLIDADASHVDYKLRFLDKIRLNAMHFIFKKKFLFA